MSQASGSAPAGLEPHEPYWPEEEGHRPASRATCSAPDQPSTSGDVDLVHRGRQLELDAAAQCVRRPTVAQVVGQVPMTLGRGVPRGQSQPAVRPIPRSSEGYRLGIHGAMVAFFQAELDEWINVDQPPPRQHSGGLRVEARQGPLRHMTRQPVVGRIHPPGHDERLLDPLMYRPGRLLQFAPAQNQLRSERVRLLPRGRHPDQESRLHRHRGRHARKVLRGPWSGAAIASCTA